MSWLISRAMMEAYANSRSLLGLVEEFSEATCSDGEPSALLSGSPTPQAFLSPDRMKAFSRLSRFGMTFKPLTDALGADVLMWCQEDSRVRTSASPGREQESREVARECGPTWRGSLAKFDPASRSWKTAQLSLLEGSESSSVTWPRSGMTVDGRCWERQMLERRTRETGFGLWPTPTTRDRGADAPNRTGGLSLGVAMRWPTPTAHNAKEGAFPSEHERNTPTLAAQAGGALNPPWVEWLMGWPLGWTDLKPLATDKSLYAPPQLGVCLQAA